MAIATAALDLCPGAGASGAPEVRPIAVIVNRANPVTNLSAHQLRDVIMGRLTTWSNGRRVTVVLREPGEPSRDALLRFCCRLRSADYDRLILQAVFTGETPGVPKVVTSAGGVKDFVFNVPGGIGVVDADTVDNTVKAVRVDGRAPGDTGYGLAQP